MVTSMSPLGVAVGSGVVGSEGVVAQVEFGRVVVVVLEPLDGVAGLLEAAGCFET